MKEKDVDEMMEKEEKACSSLTAVSEEQTMEVETEEKSEEGGLGWLLGQLFDRNEGLSPNQRQVRRSWCRWEYAEHYMGYQ